MAYNSSCLHKLTYNTEKPGKTKEKRYNKLCIQQTLNVPDFPCIYLQVCRKTVPAEWFFLMTVPDDFCMHKPTRRPPQGTRATPDTV